MDLVTVTRRAFLPTIKDEFLAGAIVFDETETILPVQIFVHGGFHALDSFVVEIGETDNMAKHRAIGIKPRDVVLEINAADVCDPKFGAKRVGC